MRTSHSAVCVLLLLVFVVLLLPERAAATEAFSAEFTLTPLHLGNNRWRVTCTWTWTPISASYYIVLYDIPFKDDEPWPFVIGTLTYPPNNSVTFVFDDLNVYDYFAVLKQYNRSYLVVAYHGSAYEFTLPTEDPDAPSPPPYFKGDPIDLSDGSVRLDETDFSFPAPGGGIAFARTYRTHLYRYSRDAGCKTTCNANHGVGKGWQFNWDTRLAFYLTQTIFVAPDGREHVFHKTPDGYIKNPLNQDILEEYDDGGITKYRITSLDKTIYSFDAAGRIERLTDSCGRAILFEYDASGRLTRVTDSAGRHYSLDYNADDNIAHIFVERSGDDPPEWDPEDLTLVTFTYTTSDPDLLWKATNAAGETVEYAYDDNEGLYSYLTVRRNHEGACTYYAFDEDAERYTQVLCSNASYTGAPDDPAYLTHTFEYGFADDDGTPLHYTAVTDQNAHRTTYYFAGTRGFDKVEYPDGTLVRYSYDERDRLVERAVIGAGERAGYCLKTVNTWGEHGELLTTVTRKVGAPDEPIPDVDVTLTYDEPGYPTYATAIEDALGTKRHFDYDDATGQLVEVCDKNAAGQDVHTTAYTYFGPEDGGKNGLLHTATDPNGHTASYDYDGHGNLVRVSRPLLPDLTYAYDEELHFGVPTLSGVPGRSGDRVTSYEYDAMNRLITVTYPPAAEGTGSLSEHVTYRSTGDVATDTYAYDGSPFATTEYAYNEAGCRTCATFQPGTPDEALLEYAYDGMGRLVQLTGAGGNVVQYAYTSMDRLAQITYYEDGEDDRSDSFAYYPDGSVLLWTNGAGEALAYSYSASNQIERVQRGGETLLSYSYLRNRLLASIENHNGTITYGYDEYDRVTSVDGPLPGAVDRVEYAYDPAGFVTTVTYAVDGAPVSIEYAHTALSQVSQVTYAGTKTTAFTYDDITGALVGASLPNGVESTYGYDALDRVTSMVHERGHGGILDSFAYSYNAQGLCDQVVFADGRATAYAYDALMRLASEVTTSRDRAALGDFRHTLDLSGNRTRLRFSDNPATELTFAYNALNQLTGLSGTTPNAVNVTGTLPSAWTVEHVTVTPNADPAKSVAAEIRERFFVARNVELDLATGNAIEASSPDTTSAGHGVIPADVSDVVIDTTPALTFTYDANGNRASKHDGANETIYTYDELNRLTGIEYPDGSSTKFFCDPLGRRFREEEWDAVPAKVSERRFVYDGFEPVLELDESNAPVRELVWGPGGLLFEKAQDAYRYYLHDARGDVTAVTDEGGNLVAFYEYSAYGRVLTEAGSFSSRFLFAGKPYHAKSGLYDFGCRWYDPQTAQWLTRDPLHVLGGLNLYQYALGDPVNLVDPYGLCPYDTVEPSGGFLGGFIDGLFGGLYSNTRMVAANEGAEAAAFYVLGSFSGAVSFANGAYGVDRATGRLYTRFEQVVEITTGVVQMGLTGYGLCKAGGVGAKPSPGVRTGDIPEGARDKSWTTQRRQYWNDQLEQDPGRFSPRNQRRVGKGQSPIGPDGHPTELHHPDKANKPFSVQEMSRTDHRLGDNYGINHGR